MTEKNIELAKSWFVLAQIFIILAGFMFATAGVVYSNYIGSTSTLFSLTNNQIQNMPQLIKTVNDLNVSSNYSTAYMDYTNATLYSLSASTEAQFKLWKDFFNIGIVLTVISLILFFIGRMRLEKIN